MATEDQNSTSTLHSIGKAVYLSRPKVNTTSSSAMGSGEEVPQPTLIIIFGWMGAKLSHLHKYTKVYEELYPDATKLLIRCDPSFYWSRESARFAQLAPVIDALQALGHLPPSNKNTDASQIKLTQPRLLIHTFSNVKGGCSQLFCLNRLLAARFPDWNIIQPSTCALIFDSCPGFGGLEHSKRAMSSSVRNGLLKLLLNIFVTLLYVYSALVRKLFGTKGMPELLKSALNTPRLLPWMQKNTPRLYLYSKKDEMVPFQDIEAHAGDARTAGLNVRSEVFENSTHVSHARVEPVRYWAAVNAVWEDAC